MMARFRIPLMASALAGLLTLGSDRPVEAAFRLTLVDDASNQRPIDDLNQDDPAPQPSDRDFDIPNEIRYRTATTANPTANFGGFVIDISAKSNGPGNATLAFVTESLLTLSNVDGVTRTLTIIIEDDESADFGFSGPVGPPLELKGELGGPTSNAESPDFEVTMQSTLIPQTGTLVNLGAPLSTTSTTLGDSATVIVNRSAPFDLRQVVTVTLAAGQDLVFTATTNVRAAAVPAVPEPSSIAVAGLGIALSLGVLRRRNRA